MARWFRFFALLSALVVIAVRSVSGLPLAQACNASLLAGQALQICPPSEQPADEDLLAPVAINEDADDGADALLTPAAVDVRVLSSGEGGFVVSGAIAPQRALPSHAQSLERPPRG